MPYPLHHHVADVFVRVITTNTTIILSHFQTHAIHAFVRNLPARLALNLLSHVNEELPRIPFMDNMEIDEYLTDLSTANTEQYLLILNHFRIIFGMPSWLPTDSCLNTTGMIILTRMYEDEVNDGMTPTEINTLYHFASRLQDDYGNPNNYDDDDDDTASIATDATEDTIPLERTLDELNSVLDSEITYDT
jgi:hypothetical protein